MANHPASLPPAPRTDVGLLRAFLAVARTGSVSRAARLLGRSQPSVSERIASLEQSWGIRLFRRVARGMTPTPEAARLIPAAEAVLHQLDELDRSAGMPLHRPEVLRVGSGDALGRRKLPSALGKLLARSPEVEIRVQEGPGPVLLEAVRAGEIDLAIVVSGRQTQPRDGLDLEPWLESEVELLAPRGEAKAAADPIALAALADERLITLQPGSAFRLHVESAFAAQGIPFQPAVEVGNLSLVRRFVIAGLGVAPVPAIAFSRRDRAGTVRRLALPEIPPVIYARAIRQGAPVTPVVDRFLRLLGSAG